MIPTNRPGRSYSPKETQCPRGTSVSRTSTHYKRCLLLSEGRRYGRIGIGRGQESAVRNQRAEKGVFILLPANYKLRIAEPSDYDDIIEICKLVYPTENPYTVEELADHGKV